MRAQVQVGKEGLSIVKMASDLDDKAKRVRSLLSSYYGTDAAEQGSKGGGNGARSYVGIDDKGFDADRYVASLVSPSEIPIVLLTHFSKDARIVLYALIKAAGVLASTIYTNVSTNKHFEIHTLSEVSKVALLSMQSVTSKDAPLKLGFVAGVEES